MNMTDLKTYRRIRRTEREGIVRNIEAHIARMDEKGWHNASRNAYRTIARMIKDGEL